jgi:hypothetical protein
MLTEVGRRELWNFDHYLMKILSQLSFSNIGTWTSTEGVHGEMFLLMANQMTLMLFIDRLSTLTMKVLSMIKFH